MSQLPMYGAKINSPTTTLTVSISETENSIQVADVSKLPPAPNLIVLGTDEDCETVFYENPPTGNLLTIQRAFQGVAKAWASGTFVTRYFTAYDHDTFKANIEDLTEKVYNNPIALLAYAAIFTNSDSAQADQALMSNNNFPLAYAIFRRIDGGTDYRNTERLNWITPLNPFYGNGNFRAEVHFTHSTSTNRNTVWNIYAHRFSPNYPMTATLLKVATVSFDTDWDSAYAGSVTSLSSEFSLPGEGNLIFWEVRLGTISDGDEAGSGDSDTKPALFISANIYPV